MHFIGIDIGTSSVSSVVYDYKRKKTESFTTKNDSVLPAAAPWEKLQSPQRIIEIVTEIMEGFFARYSDIRGIGVTGQMHGMLYLDNRGEAISPLYTWQDGRGNQLYQNNQTYACFLSEETGYALASGFGAVTHHYNRENGLIPAGANQICTIMDYVVMKLTGRPTPLTDHSTAASLGFFDLERLTFDRIALKKVGIDPAFLPETVDSVSVAGYYKERIPVYPAIGDNQAAFLGSVKDKHTSLHITVGTGSQISVYSEKYLKIPTFDTRPFPGGGYLLVGAALCGGQAYAILKNFFEKTLKKFTSDLPSESDIYRIMGEVSYKENTNDLPLVETLFNGTRFSPDKRGSITSISSENFTPDNLILAFLKGISKELYNFYEYLPEEIKKEKDIIIGSGNALKKNPLLCKAFEEQFHINLSFSGCREEAAFGACLNAIKEI